MLEQLIQGLQESAGYSPTSRFGDENVGWVYYPLVTNWILELKSTGEMILVTNLNNNVTFAVFSVSGDESELSPIVSYLQSIIDSEGGLR